MAENLRVHATTQRDRTKDLATAARAALTAANTALSKRVPDPSQLDPDTWRTTLGAAQYLEATVAYDTSLRAAEADLRARLAAIPTPADHAELVAKLTANLLAQTQSRVLRRDAQERLAVTQGDVAAAGAAATAADAELANAEQWLATATAAQDGIAAEKALLTAPPLDTVAADAAALMASSAYSDAEDQLRSRLPTELFDRSAQRYAEADFVTRHYPRVAAAAQVANDKATTADDPLSAAAAAADRDLSAARAALRGYAASAPDVLVRAAAILARVAKVPALTADETAMLAADSPRRPDAAAAVAAVPLERTVATTWEAYVEADIAVWAAIYTALVTDSDADPHTAPAVIAATDARDAPEVAGALNTAKQNYTATARAALDAWEAAAPGWLWDAVRDFHEADALLDRLSDAATVTNLRNAVDAAADRVAAARDALAANHRTAIRLAAEQARADARAAALTDSRPQRVDAFVRGDDLGGRHDDEF